MVNDNPTPAGPALGDWVRLQAPNPYGHPDTTTYLVASLEPDSPTPYVLYHQDGHPDREDWAAAVAADDIAFVLRFDAHHGRGWRLPPKEQP